MMQRLRRPILLASVTTVTLRAIRIIAAFGTVFFGLFSSVGNYRVALFYAGFLYVPAALAALFLPRLHD